MKIPHKQLLGTLATTSLLAVFGGMGMRATHRIGRSFDEIVSETLPVVHSLEEMRTAALEAVAAVHHLPEAAAQTKIEHALDVFDAAFVQYVEMVTQFFPDEIELLDGMRPAVARFRDGTANLRLVSPPDRAAVERLHADQAILLAALERAREHEAGEIAARRANVESTIAETRQRLTWLGVGFALFAAGIGIALARSIAGRVRLLQRASGELGRGRFDARTEVRGRDEIAALGRDFNRMAAGLERATNDLVPARDFVDGILQSMTDIVLVACADGTVRSANRAACNILGYDTEELIGKPIDSLLEVRGPDAAATESVFRGSTPSTAWTRSAGRSAE